MIGKWFLLFSFFFWSRKDVYAYELILNNNSPVTTGSNVTVNATVIDDRGYCATGDMTFRYEDDAFPRHKFEVQTKNCEVIFQIHFETKIGPSIYRYQVDVKQKLIFIDRPIASGRGQLNITENLNGQLQLFQNNTNISKNSPQTIYVPSNIEIEHKIKLNTADFDFLNKSASSITVYWFIDCIYIGNTTNYSFFTNYSQPNIQHDLLGIVVANIGQPPVITTTVSPTTSTSTSVPNITDSTSAAYAYVTPTTATTITTTIAVPPKTDTIPSGYKINSTLSSDCMKKTPDDLLLSTTFQLENLQKYGYFSRSILVKDPVANVKTQGKVWIQEGEMLDLQVNCNGSGPFRYCAHYVQGPYNVTGNESCTWDRNLLQCQMQFFHYFHEPTNYTLVVILANDVSKIVTPIGINIYKVQKQPQISVIVVPVTFSSIAVIIVVFGIAYYFQNRSRYMVEVADFDFANNSDMEYKTFRERLRDAISQAINRTQDYSEYDGSEEHIGNLAAPQNQKYGSMQ